MTDKFDLEKWARGGLSLDMRQECYDYEAGVQRGRLEGYNKGYEQGRKEARRWISVEERLPEEGLLVLVSFCGIVSYGKWDGYFWLVNDEPKDTLLKVDRIRFVTDWQPLPQAPQGGE